MGGVQFRGTPQDSREESVQRIPGAGCCELRPESALVHDLDAAGVQSQGTDNGVLFRLLIQHHHVHSVQAEFTGQEDSRRSCPGDDYFGHRRPPRSLWTVISAKRTSVPGKC